MRSSKRLTTKDLALTTCFAALYAVLSFLPLSQLVGLFSKAITAATIIAPLIGMILGAYLGVFSTFLGGLVSLFVSPFFSPSSLVAGVISSLFAGWLYTGKRSISVFVYSSLLFLFGFYPFVGPVWIYPYLMWFQVIGLLILISPLQTMALKMLNSNINSRLLSALLITSLVSTLAGQIAGSVTFELTSWPIFLADLNAWRADWQVLTFLYPVERAIIAFVAALIGVPLLKATKTMNMTFRFHQKRENDI